MHLCRLLIPQFSVLTEYGSKGGGGGGCPLPPTGITGLVGGGRVEEFVAVDDVLGPEGDEEGPGCGGVGIPGNLFKNTLFFIYNLLGLQGTSHPYLLFQL